MNTATPARRALALLTSTCALAAFATPGVAFAQEPAVSDETEQEPQRESALDALNTIVVTGTKTQNVENVQDVPLAVTAFNTDTLEAFKVRDIQGLGFQAPNVSLDQIGTSRGQANFSIRGLGINSSIPSIDPTVGVFVDGVYLGINGGVVFDIFDIESVEILRGPQGVLFGRNVTGGAVVLNTTSPTNEFRGKFRAAVDGPIDEGRGGENYTISGVVSGPLVEDKLLFKVAAYHNNDQGYFRNLFNGENFGEAETTIVRGALEARLGDLTLTGKVDYFDSEGDGPAGQNRGQFARESFDFAIDNTGFYDTEILTTSLTAEWDIGPGTLTNIFGYRDYEAATDADIDATTAFLFHSNTETAQDQISNEIRYAVSTDSFDITVGGFYFDQTLEYTEVRDLPFTGAPTFFGGGRQDHQVLGLFANGQYYLTEQLSVIAGIRWSEETKDADITFIRPRPECSVVDGTCPTTGTNPFVPGEENGFSDEVTFTNVSPKLGLQYEFASSQVYGHWTRGFRSGGYNFRITNIPGFQSAVAVNGGDLFFGEEQVDNFEIGGKFQTDDGVFTLNMAAYVTKIEDMQREVNVADPGAGVVQNILNTADATITGFEAEARVRATDSLILTANVGLIDADYDEVRFDISGDGVIDQTDLDLALPRVPEATFGFGFIHEWLVGGDNEILTRVNYQWRDEFAYTDNNFGFVQSISNLEANITWVTPLEGFSLSVYGRNLFDEVQVGGDTQLSFTPGVLSNGVNQPFDRNPAAGTFSPLSRGRNVGVEAVLEF